MISQRAATSAPVVQARAEQLPFADRIFDAVLGVLTLHHWADAARGLAECHRVAADRVAFFTLDAEVGARFWLFEYFPEIAEIDRRIFPSMGFLSRQLGEVIVTPVPIPADCLDGFGGAYWKRPSAYLDPTVRAGMSTFSRIKHAATGLRRLQHDLQSDLWIQRHQDLLDLDELDLGYRIVTARAS
ncbi:MAG: methyltransferase domain-containing protein [Hyphomicrobium aestuarii]|nr:methyltransferase domain-containing protein [Hyphomicrobium aestuarii]